MDEGVVSRLADNLQGAGLIGSSHKSQYIKWMLGKVRGDRRSDHYRRPHPRDNSRVPKYAGWSPEQWDGKYKPFHPEDVGTKSKFIQTMVSNSEKEPPHNRRYVSPPVSEVRKRHRIAREEGFPTSAEQLPKTIEGLRELSARIMALPKDRRPTLYGDDLRVFQPKSHKHTRWNFRQRLALGFEGE